MQLTEEQGKKILELWNATEIPPSLKEITKELSNGQEVDGRSELGRLIKEFLSKYNLKAKATSDRETKIDKVELTEEHKSFITNNVATMNALEISRTIFNNEFLTSLNAEARVVNDFIKTLDPKVIVYHAEENADIPDGEYEPPNTFDKTLKIINKYINFTLDKTKLNGQQKKGVETLMNYLHTHRFVRQMNEFDSDADRKTCEDAFVRYSFDKPDLSQEEVDQYIELANQTVQGIKTSRRKNLLEDRLAEMTDNTTEGMKVSMGLVEAIGKAGTEYDQCHKRQQKLLDDLKEKRSARISKQIKDSASILNLVRDWRDEERRKKMIKLGELEQQSVAKEVENLTSMEEIRARILGLDKNSILNG